ncbi:ADP-ribosyltransferase [Bacillus toyonensis]|uniref:ADP-ribosyltransferase n=1 Tax=Bacillus toyonensis TaxID=155322 RepID=UPI001C0E55D0|nr:ADP-ribosyltransferase [Bacillus toyonensis]MBU4642187.1 hypothetical protein [Bacillus toyonensis]
MKTKKEFLKVLSMSFLLTALTVNAPMFSTIVQGAGGQGGTNTVDPDKDRDKDRDKDKEEEQRKKHEEEMKRLIQHIVKTEVKEEGVAKKEAVETLLKTLPIDMLEMYEAVGGKIVIVDGKITESDELKNSTERQIKNIDGELVSLDQHSAYAKGGTDPVIVIQASEDYGYDIEKSKNVYYEIGKAIIRDVLKPEMITNSEFINLLNKIKADEYAPSLLFSETLEQPAGQFTERYVQNNRQEIQNVFARAFAYYVEPHSTAALEFYARDAFQYMETIDWKKLKALDFDKDVEAAEKWAEKNFNGYAERLNDEERNQIDIYTTGNYSTINSYLRNPDESQYHDKESLVKKIDTISGGLKKLGLPADIVVYRRTGADTFKPDSNKPNQKFDFNNPTDIESFKKQYEGSIIEEKAFLSTSLVRDPDLYSNFMQKRILMRITLPKGTHAGFLPTLKLGTYQGENEMLVDYGYSYKIDKIGTVETDLSNNRKRMDVFVEATILPKN